MSINKIFVQLASGQPDFTQEVCIREFEPERPVPQNPTSIVYRARFQQLRAYYQRPAANAAHPNLPQVYFADDIGFQDRLSGLIEWTRVWSTLPTSYNDAQSYVYSYPALISYNTNVGRAEFTQIVTSRLVKDYFLIGTLPTFKTNTTNYDDLNNAAWIKAGATTTPNAGTIPVCAGGTLVAAKIVESNTNAIHLVSQATTLGAGLVAASMFVRAAERSRAWVRISDVSGNTVGDATLDMLTGNFTETVNANCTIAAVGDGWWRVNLRAQCAANANIGVAPALTSDSHSYLGDGASGIYAWRGMVAPNTTPTPTIPPTLTPDGGGNSYPIATVDAIPSYFGLRYFFGVLFSSVTVGGTVANIAITGTGMGLTDLTFIPNSNTIVQWTASNPSLTNFNANVTTDAGNANSYSIEAEGSTLQLINLSGSLWERTRRQVKAR